MIKLSKSVGWTLLSLTIAFAADKPSVKMQPFKFGGSQEFGSVSQMSFTVPQLIQDNEWIDHFGAYFLQEATVDEKVDLAIGLGGVFQFPKPETVGERYGGSQYKLFFVGPAVAKATYNFGDREKPILSIGGGMFPYKYNPEAANLGEYLFRAAPYPSYIMTGGLNAVNDNGAYLEGFTAKLDLGRFQLDLLLPTETSMPPFYDWSLAAVGRYTSESGLFDLGLGINFKRALQVRPSRTSKQDVENSFFTKNGIQYTGNTDYYLKNAAFYSNIGDTVTSKEWSSKADSVVSWKDTTGKVPGASYYTFAGTMVMARGTLAMNKIFNLESLGENDLKLYFEAALMGVKNYPVFYEKRMNRLPIMVGANLPTFKLLDIFAVQAEYFNGNFMNSTYSIGASNRAVPFFPDATNDFFSQKKYLDVTDKDNISWSVVATKSYYKAFSISAQIARDHMRTVGTNWFYGPRTEPNEVMRTSNDWYWMLQFGWKI